MEVKEASARYVRASGFKQTEVGVIPEDWEIVVLGQLLRRNPNYGINAPAIPFDSRFPTYLRITDIMEDGRFNEATKASVNHPASSAYLLEPGDVVFARTGASVGKSYLYNTNDGRLVFAGFLIRLSPDPERLVPAFLSFFAQSRSYWSWVKVNSMRSGQPGINGREYASLPIPLPPTKAEQEAIAEALSDADALIESLSSLIAKKRQIKQGAMQELLTGKKRLPGFSGEWEVKRLGDVADTDSENLGSDTRQNYSFNYIALEDVDEGVLRSYSEQVFQSAPSRARRKIRQGDVLVSTVRPNLKSHLLFSTSGDNWVCSTGFCVVRCRKGVTHPYFVFSHMFTGTVMQQLEALLTGSNYPAINSGDVRALEISFPEYEEQTAIAAVLSDMDAEIAALEEKLAKARAIKQGMMQELLTGRIRLV